MHRRIGDGIGHYEGLKAHNERERGPKPSKNRRAAHHNKQTPPPTNHQQPPPTNHQQTTNKPSTHHQQTSTNINTPSTRRQHTINTPSYVMCFRTGTLRSTKEVQQHTRCLLKSRASLLLIKKYHKNGLMRAYPHYSSGLGRAA